MTHKQLIKEVIKGSDYDFRKSYFYWNNQKPINCTENGAYLKMSTLKSIVSRLN